MFKDDCNICGIKDATVWEVVPGVALCDTHEDEWYPTGLSAIEWVAQKHVLRMVAEETQHGMG